MALPVVNSCCCLHRYECLWLGYSCLRLLIADIFPFRLPFDRMLYATRIRAARLIAAPYIANIIRSWRVDVYVR